MPKNNLQSLAAFVNLYYDMPKMVKCAYIRKLPNGKYRVFSEKGKNMGTYNSRDAAKNRLRQIEFFKHKKASHQAINLSHLDELSYSAIVRELRKQSDQATECFLHLYKNCFDEIILARQDDNCALPLTLMMFNKYYKLQLPKHD